MNALFGNVPKKTSMKKAIFVLIMNIFLPGSGTVLLGCMEEPKNNELIKTGVLQFIAAIFVVGWIWSIWWGIELVKQAAEEEEEKIQKKVDDMKEPFTKAEEDVEKAKEKVEGKGDDANGENNAVV